MRDLKTLFKSPFIKNVLILASGAGIAGVIPFVFLPLLTRVYSPTDFGVYTTVFSLVNIVSLISTLRFEDSFFLVNDTPTRFKLLYNCGKIVLMNTMVVGLLIIVLQLLGVPDSIELAAVPGYLWWLMPFFVFTQAINTVLTAFTNSHGGFKKIARNRTLEALSNNAVAVGMGKFSILNGLVIGRYLGHLVSALLYLRHVIKQVKEIEFRPKARVMKLLKKYRHLPTYLLPSNLLSKGSLDLNMFFIGVFFGVEQLGFIGLAYRLISVPNSFIAAPVGNVFKRDAMIEKEKTNHCKSTYKRTLIFLVAIGLPIFLAVYFVLPYVFVPLFGEEWQGGWQYVRILTPMFFLNFVASPLTQVFVIRNALKTYFIWHIGLFVSTVLVVYLGGRFDWPIFDVLFYYMMIYSVMYILNIYLSYVVAKK